ncbi:MAG: hypothetical protein CM1200mP3_13950 [Chloroflexota bacterium]|nr:MAG: hypothetical protein CM1200mP3_13950 [Chloroflexota bacterium]
MQAGILICQTEPTVYGAHPFYCDGPQRGKSIGTLGPIVDVKKSRFQKLPFHP